MSCADCGNIAKEAREIVAEVGSEPEKVIPLLQEIQNRHGYLSQELVEAVAEEIKLPVSRLYGVATFYSQFRFEPIGKNLIKVCKGTACHVAGAEKVYSIISEKLGIEEGETTDDQLFTLESVACLGCCSLAPVVMINDSIYGKLNPAKMGKILKEYADGK
ncbi:MAG: NADH-quinone oxidoreductase subunit NuoE [Spirochaetales bacterium]|uniref:NADH-quinone oxidoreductase subunit NuoE n=1 Tax=Candidatus Thalassospirochaeta sargassi TaxID=3119039 RepID=A0AAJ1MNB2_9SPIO|nr:NADH-quinone oxidoreductase subunit NuoE [Spirochaetales bacterium]